MWLNVWHVIESGSSIKDQQVCCNLWMCQNGNGIKCRWILLEFKDGKALKTCLPGFGKPAGFSKPACQVFRNRQVSSVSWKSDLKGIFWSEPTTGRFWKTGRFRDRFLVLSVFDLLFGFLLYDNLLSIIYGQLSFWLWWLSWSIISLDYGGYQLFIIMGLWLINIIEFLWNLWFLWIVLSPPHIL